MTVDEMLSRPGMYTVSGLAGVFVCEVLFDGACYQCEPEHPFRRDGVLSRGGWDPEAMKIILGPFSRKRGGKK